MRISISRNESDPAQHSQSMKDCHGAGDTGHGSQREEKAENLKNVFDEFQFAY